MHDIRRKWLRLSAPHPHLPAQLDRTRCTQQQARVALAESAERCTELLAEALDGSAGRVDAHHRGQACMLAHQLGFPLPTKTAYSLWVWEKLWKQCGFAHPR